MNPFACNYNLNANEPDGSCEACIFGCNDPNAINYDPNVDSLAGRFLYLCCFWMFKSTLYSNLIV